MACHGELERDLDATTGRYQARPPVPTNASAGRAAFPAVASKRDKGSEQHTPQVSIVSDQQSHPQVWIGLAEVHQRPGSGVPMDRNSAYVSILAMATTALEFEQTARDAFAALGFDLAELEDAEPFAKRLSDGQVDSALLSLANEVEVTGAPRFGTFHTWTSDEDADL